MCNFKTTFHSRVLISIVRAFGSYTCISKSYLNMMKDTNVRPRPAIETESPIIRVTVITTSRTLGELLISSEEACKIMFHILFCKFITIHLSTNVSIHPSVHLPLRPQTHICSIFNCCIVGFMYFFFFCIHRYPIF